ncbi:Gfo/Idh/MocA family oxidoreductase [soil metagenome]
MVTVAAATTTTTAAATPTLRYGVVGAGYIAGAHLAALTATPGVSIVGVADPVAAKAARLADVFGCRAVSSLGELLELGVDAVSVCTPSPTHADEVVAALRAGRHVLCEKPIARSVDDARRIISAGDAAQQVLMIGHVSRFEPDHARAAEVVLGGAIGDVRSMTQSIRSPLPDWSEGSWLHDPAASGGPLIDLAIHSFDYLTWIARTRPVRVRCVTSGGTSRLPTYSLSTVRYESGAMALVEASWAHPAAAGLELETEIVGTGGRVRWDYGGIRGGTSTTGGAARTDIEVLGNRGFEAEIGRFCAAIRTAGPPPVPAADGLVALRIALAAAESARTGQPVEIDEVSP